MLFNAWITSLFANRYGFHIFKGQPWRATFHRGRLIDADWRTLNAYGLMLAHFEQTGF